MLMKKYAGFTSTSKYVRRLALLLSLILLVSFTFGDAFGPVAFADGKTEASKASVTDYDSYRASLNDCDMAGVSSVEACSEADYSLSSEQGIKLNLDIVDGGCYFFKITYRVTEAVNGDVKIGLKIDGEYPFEECDSLILQAQYTDPLTEFATAQSGDQITPGLELSKELHTAVVSDMEYDCEPYVFMLREGNHTLEIGAVSGAAVVTRIILEPKTDIPSYEEYIKKMNGCGFENSEKINQTVQAERPDFRTSEVVMAFCESSSASTVPVANKTQVLNAIGGSTWNLSGQAVTYGFTVSKAGFYCISLKYWQDYTSDAPSLRRIMIDGDIPFEELANVSFAYSAHWSELILGDSNDEPYKIYLDKGEHTLTVVATLGSNAAYLKTAEEIISRLNTDYRQIVMLTGTKPDAYRDYELDTKIPNTVADLEKTAEELYALEKELKKIGGANTGTLKRLAIQLDRLVENPANIPKQISQLKENISALGTWVYTFKEQPLALDSWTLFSPDEKQNSSDKGFLTQAFHSFKQFVYSFTDDYSIDGNTDQVLNVWAPTGRDQAQIIKRLIEESFENENEGIKADLRIVDASAILPAMVAGIGPDIYLMAAAGDPVNYAVRGAIVDLSTFSDYGEVSKRFLPSASVPFTLSGGVYALPETQTFNMLFYRTDIFEELGLSVPETWDDVTELLFKLGKKNMQFGLSASLNTYAMLLSQACGSLYNDRGTATLMNENEALRVFERYCDYYSRYDVPVSYDFMNRFRSGEMPVALAEYTAYNTLRVFAPELDGLYEIAPVPGTVRDDGTVSHDTVGTVTGAFMLESSDKKEAGWKFLKWWTGDDIQAQYGKSIENKLGASARYATANVKALSQIPWSEDFFGELSNQQEQVIGMPEVPGGYFTSRHFTNAFRSVVYSGTNARETLIEYSDVINDEIRSKHEEFGLWTEDVK